MNIFERIESATTKDELATIAHEQDIQTQLALNHHIWYQNRVEDVKAQFKRVFQINIFRAFNNEMGCSERELVRIMDWLGYYGLDIKSMEAVDNSNRPYIIFQDSEIENSTEIDDVGFQYETHDVLFNDLCLFEWNDYGALSNVMNIDSAREAIENLINTQNLAQY